MPVGDDGLPGRAVVTTRDTPPGPQIDRQNGSHIHQVVLGSGDEVWVVDLGADQVVNYLLQDGELIDPVVSAAPPGSGPRHMVLLPDGTAAVSGELGSVLLRAGRSGRLLTDWTSSPATDWPGTGNFPSDLLSGADGEVLIANRGADSIAALSVSTGAILREESCGAWPRQMVLHDGRLYVAATKDDQVSILDAHTLLPAAPPIEVSQPLCVVVTPDPES